MHCIINTLYYDAMHSEYRVLWKQTRANGERFIVYMLCYYYEKKVMQRVNDCYWNHIVVALVYVQSERELKTGNANKGDYQRHLPLGVNLDSPTLLGAVGGGGAWHVWWWGGRTGSWRRSIVRGHIIGILGLQIACRCIRGAARIIVGTSLHTSWARRVSRARSLTCYFFASTFSEWDRVQVDGTSAIVTILK